MKHSPEIYARAFLESLGAAPRHEQGGLMKRFLALVHTNGDWPNAPRILGAVERLVVRERGGRWVRVECARTVRQGLRAMIQRHFGRKDRIEIASNPSLIAGIRVTMDGRQELDYSFQRKLKRLFPGRVGT